MDSQGNSASCFRGVVGESFVSLRLEKGQEGEQVSIEMRHQVSFEQYSLLIDQAFLRENSLLYFFQSPFQLFHSLVFLFQELRVVRPGQIDLEIKTNLPHCRTKKVTFSLVKQQIDQAELLRKQMEELRMGVWLQLEDQKREIRALQEAITQLRRSQQNTDALKDQVESLRQELGQLRATLKKGTFAGLKQEKEANQEEPQQISQLVPVLKQIIPSLTFDQVAQNPHRDSFSIKRELKCAVITKIKDDNSWSNFVSNLPIQEAVITVCTVKQVRTKTKDIMMGVATANVFGVNAYEHQESLAYNSWNGYVYENGEDHKGGPCVNDGSIVQIRIDLINYRVEWMLGGSAAAETVIPAQMRNKRLFLVLQFLHKDSQLEVLLDQNDAEIE